VSDQVSSHQAASDRAHFVVRETGPADAQWIERVLHRYWGSPNVYARGRVIDARKLPGFAAIRDEEEVGLVTYAIDGDECQIVTHNSMHGHGGIGSCLLAEVRRVARENGCKRIWLVATNDNTNALRFYQRRDFEVVALHRDSMREARALQHDIPDRGHADIPIRHEFELEFRL